jgi:hypothetical protein
MLLVGMVPQNLILYAKSIVIRLGDGLCAVNWLGNYPIARNLNESLANFYFLKLFWVYAGCNGVASVCTWEAEVQLAYIRGQLWCRAHTSSKIMFLRRDVLYCLGKNSK